MPRLVSLLAMLACFLALAVRPRQPAPVPPTTAAVSAAMYLLLRTQDISNAVFVVPSTQGEADTYTAGRGLDGQ